MATKKSPAKPHIHYHKDGTIWAKGKMAGSVMTGYWEWFRKDGSKLRSGHLDAGQQIGEWTTYDKQGNALKTTMFKPKQNRKK